MITKITKQARKFKYRFLLQSKDNEDMDFDSNSNMEEEIEDCSEIQSIKMPSEKQIDLMIAMYRFFLQTNRLTLNNFANFIISQMAQSNNLQFEKQFIIEAFKQHAKILESSTLTAVQECIIAYLQKQNWKKTSQNSDWKWTLSNWQVNILSHFLKINSQFKRLFRNPEALIFSTVELSQLFSCNAQQITDLEHIFILNRAEISYGKQYKTQYDVIIYLYLLKLKAQICKILNEIQHPKEGQLENASAFIHKYNSISKNPNSSRELCKLPLSIFCGRELNFGEMNNCRKLLLKKIFRGVAAELKQWNEELDQLKRLSQQYHINPQTLIQQYKRTKKNQAQKCGKIQAKKDEVLKLLNYYRYKHNFRSVQRTVQSIQQSLCIFDLKSFIQYSYQEEIRNMCKLDEKSFIKISIRMIEIMRRLNKCVMFVDHCEFFKSQFSFYNKSKHKVQTQQNFTMIQPHRELFLTLITGISFEGLIFYDILPSSLRSKIFKIQDYFNRLKQICELFGERLPKLIVIRMSWKLINSEWESFINLAEYLSQKGTTLLMLPPREEIFNPNKQLYSYLLRSLFPILSLQINDEKFQSKFIANIASSLKKISQKDLQTLIRFKWQKNLL